MTISFQIEPWSTVRSEIERLLPLHWAEVAGERDHIKLDPDWEWYAECDRQDMLQVLTARADRTELVGYHLSIIRTHPHYKSTLMGFTDIYFIAPEYRKGRTGIQLFIRAEEELRARGVRKIFTGTKLSLDMAPILLRLGWRETERLFTKYLGD